LRGTKQSSQNRNLLHRRTCSQNGIIQKVVDIDKKIYIIKI